ncbi:MAG TPA: gluconate 2-dehydrogenase subunit 3 family protein [Thermomicrobiales bacterium]|jgi:gluconate 2-dehydrogenase gamma chain|nr:gluconate 2-dehydrogenase subunit 3 family protein [Thermomicrobiales bacterium]
MSDHNDAVRDETEPQVTAPGTTEAGAVFDQRRVDRRRLLGTAAATGAAAAVIPLTLVAVEAQDSGGAATPEATPMGHDHMDMPVGPPTNVGFTYFVPYQAAIVQAAAARIIPTDELGPGATEAGVVLFIDRQINRGASMDYRGPRYSMGPFLTGEPTQGDQSGMNIRDQFRVGIFALDAYAQTTFGQGFVACTAEQQDQLLTDLSEGRPENFAAGLQAQPISQGDQLTPNLSLDTTLTRSLGATAFFTMLRNWTMAGYFSDPVQGGNHDMVGWKMIGFPGAHISYFEDIENYNVPFEGDYISLGQYQEQMGGGL